MKLGLGLNRIIPQLSSLVALLDFSRSDAAAYAGALL